ncbi:MAG: FixH family protein [Lentisphaeria bacterium]|nr:FixH family protein [Lentisphaeria bacterium]
MQTKFEIWPYFVTFLIISFIGLMGVLFSIAIKQPVNMIQHDYYEASLNFDKHIEAKSATEKLTIQPYIKFYAERNELELLLSNGNHETEGIVYLYSPISVEEDLTFKVKLDENRKQLISTESIREGLWYVKVDWSQEDNSYYYESHFIK